MSQPDSIATLRQQHLDKIHSLFANPPSLKAVALASAQSYLDEHFTARALSAERLYLCSPGAVPGGPSDHTALVDVLLARLAKGEPTLFVGAYHDVAVQTGDESVLGGLSLAELETLVNERGAVLLIAYQEHLQAWWRQRRPSLVAALRDVVVHTPKPCGMPAQRFDAVFPLQFSSPEGALVSSAGTLKVSTVHVRRQSHEEPIQTLPLLLLSHAQTHTHVLYSPASGPQWLQRPDDIGPWLADHLSPLLNEPEGEWFVCEYTGMAIDPLATSYLQRQLDEITAIDTQVPRTVEQYQARLDVITDTRRWFAAPLTTFQQCLQDAMPGWLLNASQDDRLAMGQLLADQVREFNREATADFFPHIVSLVSFAERALQECVDDEPRAIHLKPQDIQLAFEPVKGSALTLTLTEWALETLAGSARVPQCVLLKGEPAPAWLTQPLLNGWLAQADIANGYGALLKQELTPVEGGWNVTAAADSLLLQLKLRALEQTITGRHGLTPAGLSMLGSLRTRRVIRPLTVRTWQVEGMYLIAPWPGQQGPCLLYRPLLEPALVQYASLDALLDAIKVPGALQDSILAWLPATVRPLFAQGEMRTLGSDAFVVAPPSSVAHVEEIAFMRGVFAPVIQDLAGLDSWSNDPLRWATLKAGGWSLLNGLLPLIQGAGHVSGWLGQLLRDLRQDVPGFGGDDPTRRTSAIVDMLGNLAVLLAHRVSPDNPQKNLKVDSLLFSMPQVADERALPVRIQAPQAFELPNADGRLRNAAAAIEQRQVQAQARHATLLADYQQADTARAKADTQVTAVLNLLASVADTLDDTQRTQVFEGYIQIQQTKLDATALQLHSLKQLRTLGARLGYEAHVCELLESLLSSVRSLDEQTQAHIRRLHARVSLDPLQRDAHRRELANLNTRVIGWREQQAGALHELKAVIGCGPEKARSLTPAASQPSVRALQALQVNGLWQVAGGTGCEALSAAMTRARCASQSHAVLDERALSTVERIELLDSIVKAYAEVMDRLEFYQGVSPELFDLAYLGQLQALLATLHAQANTDLTLALEAPREAAATSRADHYLIRTRGGDVYLAQRVEPTADQPVATAQLRDAEQSLVAAFSLASDGVWQPIGEDVSVPGPVVLDALIEQGQRQSARAEAMIAQAVKMIATARQAHSLQALLAEHACTLFHCAEAVRLALSDMSHPPLALTKKTRAQRFEADWRAAAARLYERGVYAHVEAIKLGQPTAVAIDFLQASHEVQVYKQDGRVRRGDDYVQVYRVLDVHTGRPLYYLHLHYDQADGRDDLFTVASLKTPAQHRQVLQVACGLDGARWVDPDATAILKRHRGEVVRWRVNRWLASQ